MTDLAPSQPYDHAVRVELDVVPLAVIRHEGVSIGDIRDLFDTGYGAIGGLIGSGAIQPAGPALAQPTGSWIEVYVSDPSQDPDHLRTDLLMPVRG